MSAYLVVFLVCLAYAAPSLVASRRHHRQLAPIMAVNVLTGWTVLGWIVALVWSLTSDVER